MSEQLGEKLTKLNRGDSVVVTIGGARYDGEVTEVKRWMCELNHGIMESGEFSIRIKLSTETVNQYELPAEYILISATEDVPQSWDVPQASVYEPLEDETVMDLGAVTGIKSRNGSS